MPSTLSREDWLDAYLTALTDWAIRAARVLWATVPADDVRGGCARILPGLLAVHERLTVGALGAVDVYMTAKAAGEGWLYDADWTRDYPTRPTVTYRGEDARKAFARTPAMVLSRIGRGDPVSDAMMAGWSYVSSIMGTEAHEIGRNVTAERVAAS